MIDVVGLKDYLTENADMLASLLPEADRANFKAEMAAIVTNTTEETFERAFMPVIARYPPAQKHLVQKRWLKDGAEPAVSSPAEPKPEAPVTPVRPAQARESNGAAGDAADAQARAEVAAAAEAAKVAAMETTATARWERWTMGLKEGVTGCLAIMIIFITLAVAVGALFFAQNAEPWQRAKDILVILSGLTGVVLGYYFGRVPAEARAAQAQSQTQAAQQEAQQAATELARTQAVVEGVVRSAQRKATQRSEPQGGIALTDEQLQQLQDVLRR